MDIRKLIRIHPGRCGGQPTVMNYRLPVRIIYELVDAGYSPEEIAWLYPFLKPEVIEALLAHREEVETLIKEHEEGKHERGMPKG